MGTKNKKEKILILIGVLIILFVAILYIPSAKIPGTTVDEFGYLFNGATIIGWDWNELMQYHPYYGMGMGILWSPLFKILYKNPEVLYQSIVALNFIFIIFGFLISNYCSKKLFPKWKSEIRIIVCLVVTFYPSNFFYAQSALSEVFLYLLFWIDILLIVKIIESKKSIWSFLLALTTCYMVIVHLRTAGIAACVGVLIIFLAFKKYISIRQLIVFLAVCAVGIIVWGVLKHNYFQNLGGQNEINTINTKISVFGMIYSMIFNIPSLIKGIAGRFYYFLVSGNIFFLFGMGALIKAFCLSIRKKNNTESFIYQIIAIFLVFTFVVNIIAFSTQTLHSLSRVDMAVYGRYMENLIAPILVFGAYYMTTHKNWLKNISYYILFIILLTPNALYRMEEAENATFAIDSAVAFGAFFKYDTSQYSIFLSLLKLICVTEFFALIIYFLFGFVSKFAQKQYNTMIIFLAFSGLVYWSYLGYGAIEQYNAERSNLYSVYKDMKILVEEQECTDIIYIRHADLYGTKAKYLQFLLPDISIKVMDYEEVSIEELNNNTLIICNAGDDITPVLREEYQKIWDRTLDIYAMN